MKPLLVYLFIVNALGFVLMLADKQKAKKQQWRIPEATLMTMAFLGGSLGVLLGMKLFHHKTLHPKFSLGVPLILAAQVLLGIFLYTKFF